MFLFANSNRKFQRNSFLIRVHFQISLNALSFLSKCIFDTMQKMITLLSDRKCLLNCYFYAETHYLDKVLFVNKMAFEYLCVLGAHVCLHNCALPSFFVLLSEFESFFPKFFCRLQGCKYMSKIKVLITVSIIARSNNR